MVLIGPVRQEILSGLKDLSQFDKLRADLSAFPDYEITTHDYEQAARHFNTCRGKGVQGSNTDFLICAIALQNNFQIFTTDQDFLRYSTILGVALFNED